MKMLLDTATMLWIAEGDQRLSSAAQNAYESFSHSAFVSVVSIWEVLVKNRLGKLPLVVPLRKMISTMREDGVSVLELNESAAFQLDKLPDLHRDPFDRMLICQAIDEDLTIITPDKMIRGYPVKSLW
jgi:PIN domain nuclease of toxin-antitoxin system